MATTEKTKKLNEIKELLQAFSNKHLNSELKGYVMKLCNKLGRQQILSFVRGRKEIWAAAIVYIIARLNFLFDNDNENFLTPDIICEFFGVRKSTVGNKATQIEKACKLGLGAEGFCSPHISDSLTLVQLPSGFVVPKSELSNREIIVEFVDGEEAEELERFIDEKRRINELEAKEKKARRTAINQKIAVDKRKKKQANQLGLFDES